MSVNVSSEKFYVVCCAIAMGFHFTLVHTLLKKERGVHLTFEEAEVSTFFLTDSKRGYFEIIVHHVSIFRNYCTACTMRMLKHT